MENNIHLPFISPVAGVSQYQSEVMLVDVASMLTIEHEPDNPYDNNACAIKFNNQLLGYLPKILAAKLVSTGETSWQGEVVEILDGINRGLRVRVSKLNSPKIVHKPKPVKEADPLKVQSKSGRILGEFVRVEGLNIIVKSAQGVEVSYPKELVVPADN